MVVMGMSVNTSSMPMVDNPYLSMTINREDLGTGFNMGVGRDSTNLVISGIIFYRKILVSLEGQ